MHGIVTALNEPLGVIGIVCPDEAPLLGRIALVALAIAMGNRVVVLPSAQLPLVATDLYQVLDTSDLPEGVVNIVTNMGKTLSAVLADHVDAMRCGAMMVTRLVARMSNNVRAATSSAPGSAARAAATGVNRVRGVARSSCARPRRSRTSGFRTACDVGSGGQARAWASAC